MNFVTNLFGAKFGIILAKISCLSCLGQYLLDNDIISYFGKVVEKTADHDSDDDALDEELRRYTERGSGIFIPGKRTHQTTINNQGICGSLGK